MQQNLKATRSLYIDNETWNTWVLRAAACDLHVSQWVALMVRMGSARNLDKDMWKYDPVRAPKTASGAPLVPLEIHPNAPPRRPDPVWSPPAQQTPAPIPLSERPLNWTGPGFAAAQRELAEKIEQERVAALQNQAAALHNNVSNGEDGTPYNEDD